MVENDQHKVVKNGQLYRQWGHWSGERSTEVIPGQQFSVIRPKIVRSF